MPFPNCVPNFPGFRALYDALIALIPATAAPVPNDVGSANTVAVSGDFLICHEAAADQTITLPAAPANGAMVTIAGIPTGDGGDLLLDGNGKEILRIGNFPVVQDPILTASYNSSTLQTLNFSSELDVWIIGVA